MRSRTIPRVDDLDVWSVWCIRMRPGHRGFGISHPLLVGAVEVARKHGAAAIEAYPVDNRGEKVAPRNRCADAELIEELRRFARGDGFDEQPSRDSTRKPSTTELLPSRSPQCERSPAVT